MIGLSKVVGEVTLILSGTISMIQELLQKSASPMFLSQGPLQAATIVVQMDNLIKLGTNVMVRSFTHSELLILRMRYWQMDL